jgi:methionyl-tRNA formyltransferase
MRIVFCGTPETAVPSLRELARRSPDWSVTAVLTQPDRPSGRGRRETASPIKRAAIDLGIPVYTPAKLKEARSTLESLAPDVVAVVAYGHIFRKWLLTLPPLGCVNVHFSLLPRHRGVAPVAWAILEGDRRTGVTTMLMDRGVDTGAILLTEPVTIHPDDTAARLAERLAGVGAPLLARTLAGLETGTIVPRAQGEGDATYARRLEKEDGRIDWSRSAEELSRRVRGLSPWPGTFTTYRGRRLGIHAARPLPGELPPGELRCVESSVVVGTGEGILELLRVQIPGKAITEADAWARGARPTVGEQLGVSG